MVTDTNSNIDTVKSFWENNPLWTGESKFPAGSREFFEEHRDTVIGDCFAGVLDESIFPALENRERVLDLGCGPGFWTIELAKRGCKTIFSADLTSAAVALAKKRCEIYGVKSNCVQENAESLSFADGTFTHVNCQGVIHHSPNTERCVQEIARVLKKGGTASLSVYHKNVFLKAWPLLRWPAKLLAWIGGGLKGRGRESIFLIKDVNEIVRLYDGDKNPVGKAYTKAEFIKMVEPYFEVERCYLHFFPARSFPFPMPNWLHQFLDRGLGFLVYVNLKKK